MSGWAVAEKGCHDLGRASRANRGDGDGRRWERNMVDGSGENYANFISVLYGLGHGTENIPDEATARRRARFMAVQFGRSTRSTTSTISHNVRQQQPASLARRLLFPHLPPGSDLPPLFLSAACPPELNDEVYDLVALSLRAFVNTWWTKLTRYDKEFLPQITGLVTHVIHSLEQRLLDADLSLLVFDDIPALITQHYRDYRQAVSKVSTSYATGGALSLPQLFHQLQPHIAVSSDGSIDEEYFRQAFDHILRECLPSEDYAPEAERFIVREIILKVVVKDVIPLISQPWFLQKMVLEILGSSPDVLSEQVCPRIPSPNTV